MHPKDYREFIKALLMNAEVDEKSADAKIGGHSLLLKFESKPICANAFYFIYGISRTGVISLLKEIPDPDAAQLKAAENFFNQHQARVDISKKDKIITFLNKLKANYGYKHGDEWIVSVPDRISAFYWLNSEERDITYEYFNQTWSSNFSHVKTFDAHHTCKECVRYTVNNDEQGKRQHLERATEQRHCSEQSQIAAAKPGSKM
jgi:hypothetical protein